MKIQIIPSPQIINYSDGTFKFPTKNKTYFSENVKNQDVLSSYLSDAMSKSSDSKFESAKNISDASIKIEIIDDSNSMELKDKKEGYQLEISKSGIVITSASNHGIFNGVMSLVQIIENHGRTIPCAKIIDWPDMKYRGISDDISRGQVSNIENFKKIIRNIARYKMNVYMPYMEDMIQFESYPSIGEKRGALSKEEINEILDYAEKHYVEVIPIFQTLGHYENILADEKFLKYADFPGSASLDVTNEETYEFLETMLKEVFELFPSKYFHMGADESFDVGKGNSKKIVDETSLADVHAKHYKRIYDICKEHGKEVLMYGDIILRHPEILNKIPKDIKIVDWHYGASEFYNSTNIFKEAGFDYFVSPSVWNFVTAFPMNSVAIPNIENIIKEGKKNESIGMINSNWGDYGAETIKELIYFGYSWSAECAWSNGNRKIDEFLPLFLNDFYGETSREFEDIIIYLSSEMNQLSWHDLWRHPALAKDTPRWWEVRLNDEVKKNWFDLTLKRSKNDINELKLRNLKNHDHLDIYEFLIDLLDFYRDKTQLHKMLQTKFKVQNFEERLAENKDEIDERYIKYNKVNKERIVKYDFSELIKSNIEKIKSLKARYKEIWLKYYKQDNLWMIENKFDRLVQYHEEIIEDLKDNEVERPIIKSDWIYYSDNEDSKIQKAEFTKTFEIDSNVKEANLQLLGDTFAKLYINDEFVGQVFGRRSLSLYVDYERILFENIKEYLNEGSNKIKVVVENYDHKKDAGFNLIAKIKTDENEFTLKSDETWKANSKNLPEKFAVKKDYRFDVIKPNFETKRTSWIER